jgi:hypothetical protein
MNIIERGASCGTKTDGYGESFGAMSCLLCERRGAVHFDPTLVRNEMLKMLRAENPEGCERGIGLRISRLRSADVKVRGLWWQQKFLGAQGVLCSGRVLQVAIIEMGALKWMTCRSVDVFGAFSSGIGARRDFAELRGSVCQSWLIRSGVRVSAPLVPRDSRRKEAVTRTRRLMAACHWLIGRCSVHIQKVRRASLGWSKGSGGDP